MEKVDYKEMERLAEEEKLGYGEIADRLHLDLGIVVNYLEGLKIAKIKPDRKKVVSPDRRTTVGRLRTQEKLSVQEIAEGLKISKSLVTEDLLSLGINPFSQEEGVVKSDNDNADKSKTGSDEGKSESESVQEESVESIVERRRKIVRLMYGEDEITPEQIYKAFPGIPHSVIDKDIRYIKRNNILREKDVEPPKKASNSGIEKEEVTVKQVRKRKRKTPQNVSDRRKSVAEMLDEMTPKEIAEKLGVSLQTIYKDLDALEAQGKVQSSRKRRNKKEREARRNQIAEMAGKMTQREIAKELGVSQVTVSRDIRILRKQGIIPERESEEDKKERKQDDSREDDFQDEQGSEKPKEIISTDGSSETPDMLPNVEKIQEPKEDNENSERQNTLKEPDKGSIEERTQEEKSKKTPEAEQEQTDIPKVGRNNKRGIAERKYIIMMGLKIKNFARKKDFESAIKYLEVLQKEIEFSDAEKGQFDGIMRILQKGRIQQIKKQYSLGDTDNSQIGEGDAR